VPYVVHFTALGLLMLGVLYGSLGVPFRGSFAAAGWATGLFAVSYVAMGFAFAAVTGELRLGTSLAAFYCAPAFAFAGVTFPVEGMPVVGQAWSSLLPVTHYLRLLVQQGMRGAPIEASWHPVLALAVFCVAPWPFLGWRMGRLARATRQGREQ
jgi:ABC-2 type transport system permease protein